MPLSVIFGPHATRLRSLGGGRASLHFAESDCRGAPGTDDCSTARRPMASLGYAKNCRSPDRALAAARGSGAALANRTQGRRQPELSCGAAVDLPLFDCGNARCHSDQTAIADRQGRRPGRSLRHYLAIVREHASSRARNHAVQVSSFRVCAFTASPAMVGCVDRTWAKSCSNDGVKRQSPRSHGFGPWRFLPVTGPEQWRFSPTALHPRRAAARRGCRLSI
jgi:hypothetical protein